MRKKTRNDKLWLGNDSLNECCKALGNFSICWLFVQFNLWFTVPCWQKEVNGKLTRRVARRFLGLVCVVSTRTLCLHFPREFVPPWLASPLPSSSSSHPHHSDHHHRSRRFYHQVDLNWLSKNTLHISLNFTSSKLRFLADCHVRSSRPLNQVRIAQTET